MKSYSSYSSSRTDRTLDFSTSTRMSSFSHCSNINKTSEELKQSKQNETRNGIQKGNCTRKLTREEMLNKIKDVVTGIHQQEKYLKHQEEKQQRNKQLIDHLTSLTENDRKDTEHKKRECERLERERLRYEEIIRKYRIDVKSSSARFIMAQQLNDDLTKQKKLLENKRDRLRRQEKESGIDDDAMNEYISAQRVIAREREKKENLEKRIEWYEKEIAKVKKENDIKKSGATTEKPLPDIGMKPTNLVSQRVDDLPSITDIIKLKDGYIDELHGSNVVPRPPEIPRSDNVTANRFRRKYRPRN